MHELCALVSRWALRYRYRQSEEFQNVHLSISLRTILNYNYPNLSSYFNMFVFSNTITYNKHYSFFFKIQTIRTRYKFKFLYGKQNLIHNNKSIIHSYVHDICLFRSHGDNVKPYCFCKLPDKILYKHCGRHNLFVYCTMPRSIKKLFFFLSRNEKEKKSVKIVSYKENIIIVRFFWNMYFFYWV